MFWVLLVGDSSVGKSSMVKRFMEDAFDAKIRTTEGANGRQKPVQLKHGPAKLQVWPAPLCATALHTILGTALTLCLHQVWDTAGGEAWKKPVTSIYRGVHAVMVVFDPHSAASFEHAQKHWIPEVAEFAAPRAFTYLVRFLHCPPELLLCSGPRVTLWKSHQLLRWSLRCRSARRTI